MFDERDREQLVLFGGVCLILGVSKFIFSNLASHGVPADDKWSTDAPDLSDRNCNSTAVDMAEEHDIFGEREIGERYISFKNTKHGFSEE